MAFDKFVLRHNGVRENEIPKILEKIGVSSVDELIDLTVPASIRLQEDLKLESDISEYEYFKLIKNIASKNKIFRTFIGQSFYESVLPAVIQRNILENPVWYTSYTPYQAEISQGRLEALLNFQTVITDLTGMKIANASLLDEATAAAEGMIMLFNARKRPAIKKGVNVFFADKNIFPQTLDVLKTRAESLNIDLQIGDFKNFKFNDKVFGSILQYPNSNGEIIDYEGFTKNAHKNKAEVVVIADILSLAILIPPAEWGADIVVGSTQRFGIPMGYGGPHAGYFATTEKKKRNIPGRIIGISKDKNEKKAFRMALQTREQHIKREKATSNICTAQALLATMAGMFAVYHGEDGIKNIANDVHRKAGILSEEIEKLGYKQLNKSFFDTLKIEIPENISLKKIKEIALEKEINFYYPIDKNLMISINETTSIEDINDILEIFSFGKNFKKIDKIKEKNFFENKFSRKSGFLKSDVFKMYRSETEMMRYIKKLERKDFSLTHSMISLGSCTMKLNAAVEMLPLSWAEFGNLHPFVPTEQAMGYQQLFKELKEDLKAITGFDDISFQPNSGASGEHTGLLIIKKYHKSIGQKNRDIVLIPSSAHGTNPASAIMAGLKVVIVDCDENGNIDVEDLRKKAELHSNNLSSFMVTYPSTHGVFESKIMEMNEIVHKNGGQVYMDGANMNAQVGLTNPAKINADLCHLNLHKTFAVPHGGGGPGVGPVCVAKHLSEFLPNHTFVKTGGKNGISAIASSPYGSASILMISHSYIKMLGASSLKEVTKMAILNANYLASSLKDYFKILYTGENGKVAHEMILDCRSFKKIADITEADIAKRLMDYGFHAPTLSFPVHGTLMVEPTESESLQELDKFIEAMISIYNEIMEIKDGKADKIDNVLKNAPHTAETLISDNWKHSYSREKAAYPLKWITENKFFPAISRINDAFGDRNLVCSCN
ncbi:MAG: glycine dehydrogenase (aminomethyl-transferring) [Bacteroidetes bacterium 4572_128]|nr:MAG: glycine dehydrogenase (aminomethyl-transferring) [Bacteroidetes bacterium 4572_128]